MNLFLFSYDERSLGSKAISVGLGARRIRHSGSTFQGGPGKTVIIWGAREAPPEVMKCSLVNHPSLLQNIINKRDFFDLMSKDGPRIPEFTSSTKTAIEWAKSGVQVVARTKLESKSGAGIVFLDSADNLSNWTNAPLYTKYVKKAEEYRIHIIFGEIIDIQKKVLRKTHPDTGEPIDPKSVDFRVRNLVNGFIFARQNVNPPADVLTQAKKAMQKSKLDFGAVDVIYNKTQDKAYVLEINSAPGLEGATIENYVAAFKRKFG